MSDPVMCDFPDWHSEHDFTLDGLAIRHCPGKYAIILRTAAGSSVPEAAKAAARHAVSMARGSGSHDQFAAAAVEAAAPFIVAAASVELQQEVDRLSAECEALRGTVAEERATTGRRIEAVLAVCDDLDRFATGRRGDPVTITCDRVRAALASPGEGE